MILEGGSSHQITENRVEKPSLVYRNLISTEVMLHVDELATELSFGSTSEVTEELNPLEERDSIRDTIINTFMYEIQHLLITSLTEDEQDNLKEFLTTNPDPTEFLEWFTAHSAAPGRLNQEAIDQALSYRLQHMQRFMRDEVVVDQSLLEERQ